MIDKELMEIAEKIYGKLPHTCIKADITNIVYKALKEVKDKYNVPPTPNPIQP